MPDNLLHCIKRMYRLIVNILVTLFAVEPIIATGQPLSINDLPKMLKNKSYTMERLTDLGFIHVSGEYYTTKRKSLVFTKHDHDGEETAHAIVRTGWLSDHMTLCLSRAYPEGWDSLLTKIPLKMNKISRTDFPSLMSSFIGFEEIYESDGAYYQIRNCDHGNTGFKMIEVYNHLGFKDQFFLTACFIYECRILIWPITILIVIIILLKFIRSGDLTIVRR